MEHGGGARGWGGMMGPHRGGASYWYLPPHIFIYKPTIRHCGPTNTHYVHSLTEEKKKLYASFLPYLPQTQLLFKNDVKITQELNPLITGLR